MAGFEELSNTAVRERKVRAIEKDFTIHIVIAVLGHHSYTIGRKIRMRAIEQGSDVRSLFPISEHISHAIIRKKDVLCH